MSADSRPARDTQPVSAHSADGDWRSRQQAMEDWYRDFSSDPDTAVEDLLYSYEPYAATLARLRGAVLDVGGGAGLPGVFLPAGGEYVVLDPSHIWDGTEWERIARGVGPRPTKPRFVRGMGEAIPFRGSCFDAALAFWSINHAASPRAMLAEMHRVVRPGGRAFLVLEDVAPTARDVSRYLLARFRQRVLRRDTGAARPRKPGDSVVRAVLHSLLRTEWPVQHDHVAITEAEFVQWTRSGFAIRERSWKGGFLSFELDRL